MSEISSTIPFHLARAYGPQYPALSTGHRTLIPATPVDAGVRQATARMPSAIATRLVAARVPGGIDFTAGDPQPTKADAATQTLAFYRHPADRNAAATSIAGAGRVLDTTA